MTAPRGARWTRDRRKRVTPAKATSQETRPGAEARAFTLVPRAAMERRTARASSLDALRSRRRQSDAHVAFACRRKARTLRWRRSALHPLALGALGLPQVAQSRGRRHPRVTRGRSFEIRIPGKPASGGRTRRLLKNTGDDARPNAAGASAAHESRSSRETLRAPCSLAVERPTSAKRSCPWPPT
jgi:hypothetical protein